MTATELCRGFNQPNYSLITETQNLEQLTHRHTHKDTHTHTHVQLLRAQSNDNISQKRWKLQCQTHCFNSNSKRSWSNDRMYIVSVIMKEERISFSLSEIWNDLNLESCVS